MTSPLHQLFPEFAVRLGTPVCTWCQQEVKQEDFKDDLSRREFTISGFCQKCQDVAFADDPQD